MKSENKLISIRFNEGLYKKMVIKTKQSGYKDLSEFIRDAIRYGIMNFQMKKHRLEKEEIVEGLREILLSIGEK